MQATEEIFSAKEYVYEVFNNDSVFTLRADFAAGFVVRFTCSSENHLRTTLRANFKDKVEVVSRRSVASIYFAKVNITVVISVKGSSSNTSRWPSIAPRVRRNSSN